MPSSFKPERPSPASPSSQGWDGPPPDDDMAGPESDDSDSPDERPRSFERSMTMNGKPGYQPGAIVRVKLENFVTYQNAEFRPGPQLNMVIGPNGTGKSSLVCAICLGLGYHPKILGRAAVVGEFVKHGHSHAVVEIELANHPRNHVIRVRMAKEDNHRTWWLDDREVPHRQIKEVVSKLRIQIDNLCQFLPQEKVASFAGLTPIELLKETLRAAAPQPMITCHEELGDLHKKQRDMEAKMEHRNVELRGYLAQQEADEIDVQRVREREEAEKQLESLQLQRLAKLYELAREEYRRSKQAEKHLERALKRLQRDSGPALRAVRDKEGYYAAVSEAASSREKILAQANRTADAALHHAENFDSKIREIDGQMAAEDTSLNDMKRKAAECRRQIHHLRSQLEKRPPDFNAAEWNQKLSHIDHERREVGEEIEQIDGKLSQARQHFSEKRVHLRRVEEELRGLDSREGQTVAMLRRAYPDVYAAYEWVKDNQDKFEREVFVPPMLNCSLKDERYSNQVQSLMGEHDFLSFTCQTAKDHRLLSDKLYKDMHLRVAIRTCLTPLDGFRSPMARQELEAIGLDGHTIDFIQGPQPVLAMLCNNAKLHLSAVGLKDLADGQDDRIASSGKLSNWAAGSQHYRIARRREYGDQYTSTTKPVRPGKFWTDQPVDGTVKAQLQGQMDEIRAEMQQLQAEANTLTRSRTDALKRNGELDQQHADTAAQKRELQREFNQHRVLPDKIREKEDELREHARIINEAKDNKLALMDRKQGVYLDQAAAALDHKACVDRLRKAHSDHLEARILLLEAESELERLKAKNQAIIDQLEQGKGDLEKAREEANSKFGNGQKCLADFQNAAGDRYEEVVGAANGRVLEDIDTEVAAEEARMSLIQAVDPNVMRRYQNREQEITRLRDEIAAAAENLEDTQKQVAHLRGQWEPQLDELVGRINDAFAYNFEQLGCAGEVSVHKDEDFERWAIRIRVRFRENESLQVLDQHRQSGGERSVTTIFYLMSLQSMAQAPFRVVDEINQGMDPRNERMVHERMVEIACREHTSQYFLITPKLLTGLRYDEGMTVLCIASGEAMPAGVSSRMDFKGMVERRRQLVARRRAEAEALA